MANKCVIQPVILAAGKGKRIISEAVASGMGELPKVLYPLHGAPLIDYPLQSLQTVAAEHPDIEWRQPIVVVGFMQELVREHLRDGVQFVVQDNPQGTGHAVMVCADAIADDVDGVLVLNGDMPAWKPSTIYVVAHEFAQKRPAIVLSVVTFTDPTYTADFFAYGRIERDADGNVQRIVEQKDATDEQRTIAECNPSLYCFDRHWLFSALTHITNNNSQGEYYLTDILEWAITDKQPVATRAAADWREALGINTLDQLQLAEQLLTDYAHSQHDSFRSS